MKKYIIAFLFLIQLSAFAEDDYFAKVDESATYLAERLGKEPKLLIVLTAGINGPLDLLEDKVEISSTEIPYFPVARVPGHEGKLIFGKLDGVEIVLMKGRYHFYEGLTAQEVVFPYFVLNKLGVKSVITMNAVGGIRKDLDVGDIMLVKDHINLLGDNPLKGIAVRRSYDQFTDMTEAYDRGYQAFARELASDSQMVLKEGVYLAVSGPNYETKAEIGMMRAMGADFVGMSTVFEVIACKFLGMKVLAFSLITNPAADRHQGGMSHEEVREALENMSPRVSGFVTGCAKRIIAR
jgi:purine-nucleoside phosphorylase